MSKVVALLLLAGIVLLVVAPQFDLTNAVASRQHRSHQVVTFAVGSLAASLVVALAVLPVMREGAPLDRLTPILDLTCVRLC